MQRDPKAYLPKIAVSIGLVQREEELNSAAIFERVNTALYQAKIMAAIEVFIYNGFVYAFEFTLAVFIR